MSFNPTLYIGVGEKGCFFTLRETYEHVIHIPGEGDLGNAVVNGVYQGTRYVEVRSFHLKNLSQDADEAFEKAAAAAGTSGMELTTTRDSLQEEMNAVHRRSAEEMEAAQKAAAARQAKWDAEREEQDARSREVIEAGYFPFGRYAGEHFSEAPLGYLRWIAKGGFDDIMMNAIAAAVKASGVLPTLPEATPGVYVGEVKKRQDFRVTVMEGFSFSRASFSGYGSEVVYVSKLVEKETGALITVMTTAWDVIDRDGQELTIKATVKEHSEYKGEAQTVVQRVKEVV